MTLHFASSCSCRADLALVGGNLPEYLPSFKEAFQRFLEHMERNRLDPAYRYWAVHAGGRHLIAVD